MRVVVWDPGCTDSWLEAALTVNGLIEICQRNSPFVGKDNVLDAK